MPLNIVQIEHIAHLARLKLTTAEKEKFTGQLSDIIDYFEKLKQVDTSSVEPTNQVTNLTNVHRADEVKDCDEKVQKGIMNNFPQRSGKFIKVNKVL